MNAHRAPRWDMVVISMKLRRRFPPPNLQGVPLALFLASLLLPGSLARAWPIPILEPGAGYDVDRVQWSRLEYKARKFFLTAHSEVDLRIVPAAEFQDALLPLGEGRLSGPAGPGVILELRSHLLGRHSLTELWLEPMRAAAIQRIHTDSGKRHRWKTYRFAGDSVHIARREPASRDEEDLSPPEWTKSSDTVYVYPDGVAAPVSEPSSLFYLLSVVDLKVLEGGVTVPAFSNNRVSLAELRLEGREEIKVDYVVQSAATSEEVRQGPTEVLRVTLRPRSLTGGQKEALEFLGLEGDIELHLDPELRVPLQIHGHIPPVGGVTVRLQRVVLR